MEIDQLIRQFRTLPADKQAEVLDFVAFLAQRHGQSHPAPEEESEESAFHRLSLQAALADMADEPELYGPTDLRKTW